MGHGNGHHLRVWTPIDMTPKIVVLATSTPRLSTAHGRTMWQNWTQNQSGVRDRAHLLDDALQRTLFVADEHIVVDLGGTVQLSIA